VFIYPRHSVIAGLQRVCIGTCQRQEWYHHSHTENQPLTLILLFPSCVFSLKGDLIVQLPLDVVRIAKSAVDLLYGHVLVISDDASQQERAMKKHHVGLYRQQQLRAGDCRYSRSVR
jgi:hypothetical protein